MATRFLHQGHAEDVLQWHRFSYYVRGVSLVTDSAYDALEREVCSRWPINGIGATVGSDDPDDYPWYIREGRRPDAQERELRDWTIVARWLREL